MIALIGFNVLIHCVMFAAFISATETYATVVSVTVTYVTIANVTSSITLVNTLGKKRYIFCENITLHDQVYTFTICSGRHTDKESY